MNNKSSKVITITSRKGGVGKTTTILNLAGIYSNLSKKVLIFNSVDIIRNNINNTRNIFCINSKSGTLPFFQCNIIGRHSNAPTSEYINIIEIDWLRIIGIAGTTALVSILMSITGLPEVEK